MMKCISWTIAENYGWFKEKERNFLSNLKNLQMNEIWKPVKNYETLYMVSNLGQVKALQKSWVTGRGKGRPHVQPEKILKPCLSKWGYLRVNLSKESQYKKFHVHTLVAAVFCAGYFDGCVVNHKDGCKTNNDSCNLEHVTRSENTKHAFRIGLITISEHTRRRVSETHSGGKNNKAIKVIHIITGRIYDTVKEAAEDNNINVWNLYAKLRGVNKNNTNLKYA